jgi:hypothetical protein
MAIAEKHRTMIRSDAALRFTDAEITEYRKIGIDFSDAKTPGAVASEITRWVLTLADERPDLLEKIASEIAELKGVKLPPKLSVVASDDSPAQS